MGSPNHVYLRHQDEARTRRAGSQRDSSAWQGWPGWLLVRFSSGVPRSCSEGRRLLTRVLLSIRKNVAAWVGVQDMGGFLRWARLALGCVDEVPRQGSPWCPSRTPVQGRQHRQLVPSQEPV